MNSMRHETGDKEFAASFFFYGAAVALFPAAIALAIVGPGWVALSFSGLQVLTLVGQAIAARAMQRHNSVVAR